MEKSGILNKLAKNVSGELKKQDISGIRSMDDVKEAAFKIGSGLIAKTFSRKSEASKKATTEAPIAASAAPSAPSAPSAAASVASMARLEPASGLATGTAQEPVAWSDKRTSERAIPAPVTGPTAALAAIAVVSQSVNDAIKFSEAEETRREEIRACRDVAIANMASMRECLMEYLDKSFDERKDNFARLFETVDKAMEKGDVNALSLALNSINELAASSPFKALSDIGQVKRLLTDENSEIDI